MDTQMMEGKRLFFFKFKMLPTYLEIGCTFGLGRGGEPCLEQAVLHEGRAIIRKTEGFVGHEQTLEVRGFGRAPAPALRRPLASLLLAAEGRNIEGEIRQAC
jgi:hypothetical protein